ncbi:MAG TPA: glucose-1-phosphate adenylyltransferase [Paenibacillaceae bacterium]|nr:glucose-1-phosphate adenylyltransferase [Paenibacillaceae bacterium]
MRQKEIVAMLLAGGEGRRLGVLTQKNAKPAVPFGGKYRIIDFTLSNCTNSGIDTVGVLTQYRPLLLNSYIGIGSPWDLDRNHGGVTVLPPYMEQQGGEWYKGTANAIYQNISYLEQYNPQYVLIISGDHIYKMNYGEMLEYHKSKNSEVTIALIDVPKEEASRFGIMSTGTNGEILSFEEKPKNPKSNRASMGIYIFNWDLLKQYLIKDETNENSSNDFGKDIIPLMLKEKKRMYAFPFKGYWKDVGTIDSLWEAHMDLLTENPKFNLFDSEWKIYSVNPNQPPQYIAPTAKMSNSMVNEGCMVFGEVIRSVLFYGVSIGKGTLITDSIIMPNVKIGENVRIHKSIISEGTVIGNGCCIGDFDNTTPEITVVGENACLSANTIFKYGKIHA